MSSSFFGNNEYSTRLFLKGMLYVLIGEIIGTLCYNYYFHEKSFDIGSIVLFILLWLLIIIGYFIGKLIAYRSNILPKVRSRENVHIVSFIILAILIVLALY